MAFARQTSNKFLLQKLYYTELREQFGLPAHMAIALYLPGLRGVQAGQEDKPKFRLHAAVPYRWGRTELQGAGSRQPQHLEGRVIVPFLMGKYQAERFGWSKGQCDLVLRDDGKWFLLVTVDVPDGTPIHSEEFIGVDLGVINIAADSDGEKQTSAEIEAKRDQYATRRKRLGKATNGAKRRTRRHCHKALARTKAKEARFRRDINHQISKKLVAKG